MCGFSVVKKYNDGKIEIDDIFKMCSAIAHRGPDEAGYALLDNGALGMGHVRLSIMDLERGQQPIYNEDHSVCLVYSGEIYDHMEIRSQLISQGHHFRTTSDSEVIVHLYEEYGLDLFSKLNGEFAFVIWDQTKKMLILAKDRSGVKPLYYYLDQNEIIISSEVKGIFALQRIPRSISKAYLTGPFLGAFPKTYSAFSNVHYLKPGHFMVINQNGPQDEKAYWVQDYDPDASLSMDVATEGVRDIFTQAVRRRMVADVPVGVYLSGGIDSTLVCSIMANHGQNIKSFNIGFGGSIYDESQLARKIARHFDVNFETIDCSMESLAQDYEKSIYHVEMPLINPGAIGKLKLSRLVHSQGYKVCLTGEGSDEVFGGYPYFKMEKLWRMMLAGGEQSESAHVLWGKFKTLEKRSEGLFWTRSGKWRREEQIFGYPSYHQIKAALAQSWMHQIFNHDRLNFMPDDGPMYVFKNAFRGENLNALEPFNSARRMSLNQLHGYIIPAHGDRVEMANSVECRTPFLDRDLLEFTGRIPPDYFLDIGTLREKNILRCAFQGMIPEFLENEHKHPYLSPNWQLLSKTKTGSQIVDEYMSQSRIEEAGIFNFKFISQMNDLFKVLPSGSVVRREMDVLFGMILGVQLLQDVFIENQVELRPNFSMIDRTPMQNMEFPGMSQTSPSNVKVPFRVAS